MQKLLKKSREVGRRPRPWQDRPTGCVLVAESAGFATVTVGQAGEGREVRKSPA